MPSRIRAAGGKSLETLETLSNDKATMEAQLAMQVCSLFAPPGSMENAFACTHGVRIRVDQGPVKLHALTVHEHALYFKAAELLLFD